MKSFKVSDVTFKIAKISRIAKASNTAVVVIDGDTDPINLHIPNTACSNYIARHGFVYRQPRDVVLVMIDDTIIWLLDDTPETGSVVTNRLEELENVIGDNKAHYYDGGIYYNISAPYFAHEERPVCLVDQLFITWSQMGSDLEFTPLPRMGVINEAGTIFTPPVLSEKIKSSTGKMALSYIDSKSRVNVAHLLKGVSSLKGVVRAGAINQVYDVISVLKRIDRTSFKNLDSAVKSRYPITRSATQLFELYFRLFVERPNERAMSHMLMRHLVEGMGMVLNTNTIEKNPLLSGARMGDIQRLEYEPERRLSTGDKIKKSVPAVSTLSGMGFL